MIPRSISIQSEPLPNSNSLTPPSTPIRDISIHSHHSSNLQHPSIHKENYEQLTKILDIKIQAEQDFEDLNAFCYNIIQEKFKEGIKVNTVLPSASDKKTFKLKIYKRNDHTEIKNNIINTVNYPDPKLTDFLNSTIDLVLLDQMKTMERSFVSIQDKTFTKIFFQSEFKKKYLSSDYYLININLLSINFL